MKKGLEVFAVISFIFFLIMFSLEASARNKACDDDPITGDRAVCYNYNFPISSSTGFGAAEICGNCYVCGDADGVCPEDFAPPDGQPADCSGCNDPDCVAYVVGQVYDFERHEQVVLNPGLRELPVPYAQLKAIPHNPLIPEILTTASQDGTYSMAVPNGKVGISAYQLGYDSQLNNTVVFTTRSTVNVTFYLPNATCHEDCSDYFNRCNKDCQGLKNCSYADWDGERSDIADLCHQRVLGSTITMNSSGNYTTEIVCCRGEQNVTKYTPTYVLEGKMKNLITTDIPVIYNGVPGRVVIATWTAP